MQSSVDLVSSDNPLGTWSNNAFAYGGFSDYSVPPSDWLSPFPTELESSPLGYEGELGAKDLPYGAMQGGGGGPYQRIPPIEVAEADSTQQSGLYASAIMHHGSNGGPMHGFKQQPAVVMPVHYVSHGFYPSNGLATSGAPTLTQSSIYPSPPGSVPKIESAVNHNLPYVVYMNAEHVGSPMAYGRRHADTTPMAPSTGGQYGSHQPASDLYQPYAIQTPNYEDTVVSGATGSPASSIDTLPPITPKYDAWPPVGHGSDPICHVAATGKHEYLSTYSPSSSIAAGSSIKAELLSDTSQSPPPQIKQEYSTSEQQCLPPLESAYEMAPVNRNDGVMLQEVQYNPKTPPSRKAPRITADMGQRFVCPECSRTFARQCGLTQHIKWNHSGTKPFRCFTCGKCFADEDTLSAHMERHTSTDKPFQCAVCPKAFFHKNDLRRHMYQHTGTAPHVCKYCGKTFARKDHCHAHEYSHERKAQRRSVKKGKTDLTNEQLMAVSAASSSPVSAQPLSEDCTLPMVRKCD